MRNLWRVLLDSPKGEVESVVFNDDGKTSFCDNLTLVEREGNLMVSLFEGGHWEYGDRDESFPVDGIAQGSDQAWLTSEEVARLIGSLVTVVYGHGVKTTQTELRKKLGL